MQLRPVTYRWKDAHRDAAEGEQLGFIAQEVETLFPQVVHTGATTTITLADGTTETILNTKSLSSTKLVVPLVKAVQEINLKIEDLATSTPETPWQHGSLLSRFFTALKNKLLAWFADTANGITDLFAKVVHSEKVETSQLCVGSTCITETQLAALLSQSAATGLANPSPTIDPTSSQPPPADLCEPAV